MNRRFYVHESWHTSWHWRLGRLCVEIDKPGWRYWGWWSLRDGDGCPGLYTPLVSVSWIRKEHA